MTKRSSTRINKWIREGSQVLVISGNDKGRTGKVISRDDNRVKVEGVNVRKKHVKRQDQNTPGQIIDVEVAVHASNLRLCNDEGQPLKPKVRVGADGKRELVAGPKGQETVLRKLSA